MSCSKLLWDEQVLSRKQVPTVQDALACCDKQTLLYVVERTFASRMPGWETAAPQQRRVARKRMARALGAMRQCQIKRKEGKSYCVFPQEEFVVHISGGRSVIERVLQGRVVDVSSRHNCPEGVQNMLTFGCKPWAVALAYRIWLEGPWNCQERYMVLASVFWQLTHQGFEEPCELPLESESRSNGFYQVYGTRSPLSSKPLCGSRALEANCYGWDRMQDRAVSPNEDCVSKAEFMGLGVPEALEETYKERLIARVAQLNSIGQQDLQARVVRFSQRLRAA